MKYILSFFLFLGYGLSLLSQNFNPKILELPESPTIKDFSFLKKRLEGVQVIMIGENAHFDGNVFEVRNTIIQYLYYELGFKTIAFESGIYDIRKAVQEIENGEDVNTALQKALMGAWGYSKEFQSLFEFCTEHQNDIKLFGFDNQFTGDYGSKFFVSDLYSYCDKNSLKLTVRGDDFDLLIESLIGSYYFDDEDITFGEFKNALEQLLNAINNLPDTEEHFYWKQNLKCLLTLAKDIYQEQQTKREIIPFSVGESDNIRDKQMAENLLAYIERYPTEKIICLGANAHFVTTTVDGNDDLIKFISMGSHLKKALGNKLYSLASVTAQDKYVQHGEVLGSTPIKKNSFEHYLLQKNSEHIFIDANQKSLKIPIFNRLFSNDTFIKTPLNMLFDGYIFFKKWKESTLVRGYKPNFKEETIKNDVKETHTKLEGSIINSITNEPLAYALVKLPNSNTIFTYTDINGFYKLKVPIEFKKDSIEIHSSYHVKTKVLYKKHLKLKFDDKINALDEVIVRSKISAYQVMKKTIKNIKKNYPTRPFNHKRYTHLTFKVGTIPYLDIEYVSEEYDRGYTAKYRNTYRAKEIKWNTKKRKIKALPISNRGFLKSPLFNKRKIMKFTFTFNKDSIIEGSKVYSVSFSTTKKHYTYTHQPSISNYYGNLYIDKKTFAIVRLVQNWDIIEYDSTLNMLWFLSKEHSNKGVLIKEKSTLNYKVLLNRYYRKNQTIEHSGYYLDNNIKVPISRIIKTYWFDENYKKPEVIKFDKLGVGIRTSNAKYHPEFWKTFTIKNN